MVRAFDFNGYEFEFLQYGDFTILKMAAASSLDFFSILTVGTVKSAELRHYAKYCRNRSNRGRDIAIFGFFKWRLPLSWILKILNS